MERVYESGAAGSAPAAPAAPSSGYPSAGDPGLGVPPTYPGPYWFHQITEELRAVIAAAGITPDHLVLNQLLLALQGGFGLAKSYATNGYAKLPGGLIVQWGTGTITDNTVITPITLPVVFPTAFLNAVAADLTGSAGIVRKVAVMTSTASTLNVTGDSGEAAVSVFNWVAFGY